MHNGTLLAAVDLGSNSFRLEIGRFDQGHIQRTEYLKETVRLGGGLDEDHQLSLEAMQRGWACLARFAERLGSFPPAQVRAVATQTLREARNRDEFLRRGSEILGYTIDLVSGPEEARLIYQGVARLLPQSDERRLVVPLNWFIEHPFQNWTRRSSQLIGTVFLMLDFRTPLAPLREEFKRLCEASEQWDRRVCVLQVTDATEQTMQLRMLVSSTDSGRNFDLRCQVREGLIAFVQAHYPHALPRWRCELDRGQESAAPMPPAPAPQRAPSAEDGGPERRAS